MTKSIFLRDYSLGANFILYLFGPTGVFKSSISRALFCPFHPERANIAFHSTFAAFDSVLKSVRDITCLFDDFRILPTKSDYIQLKKNLEILLRSVGDLGGGRTKCIGNKVKNVICECIPVVTGEILNSDLQFISCKNICGGNRKRRSQPRAFDLFTGKHPDQLQYFLSAYIQYVISNPRIIRKSVQFYRTSLSKWRSSIKDIHGRHLEMAAWIETGFFMANYFVKRSGYFLNNEEEQFMNSYQDSA